MQFARIAGKFSCGLLLSALLVGCGTQSAPLTEINVNESSVAENSEPSNGLPLLAVPNPDDSKGSGKAAKPAKSGPTLLPKLFGKKNTDHDAAPDETPAATQNQPEKGSPEWLLLEIKRVHLLPLPHEEMEEKDDESDDSEDEDLPLTPAQEKKLALEIERNKGVRRERNQQIIKLAEECLKKTNKEPEQEPLFCAAVHYLLDARLQLALQGDKESMEALYEADKIFFERNPKSESAAESALTLVNLTHGNARRYGRTDPRWLKEFSKQTQSYATRFPQEAPRTTPMLLAAARTCEMNGQPEEARACYSMLSTKFKDTPQGQQSANVLRRLQLKGQELELAGPGIDGGDINVKAMKGKMVLVVFWASNAQPFIQQLPKLQEITTKYRKYKYLDVVGVNLDVEEKAVDSFVEANHLDWPQIFPENRQQRGWNSPLAIHYGVNSLPTMFLLDPNGIVTETNLDVGNLDAKIRETYEPFRKKTAATK